MDTIKMKKADLLVALKAKRREAARLDREATVQYKKDLAAAVKARRAYLSGLARSDDQTLKDLDTWTLREKFPEVPGCPISWVGRLDGQIKLIELDMRASLTIDTSLRTLLTLGDREVTTICDLDAGAR